MDAALETFRYPIGRFEPRPDLTSDDRTALIEELAALPTRMREAVAGLSDEQLDTPYREGGWTVRQVVHHVPDSHLNSYVRFKWTLTEDQPLIKPYDEAAWAELDDSRTGPIEMSLALLEAVHARWLTVLRAMSASDWGRTLTHPEFDRPLTLEWMLQLYAWHSRHHLEHIHGLRSRMGW